MPCSGGSGVVMPEHRPDEEEEWVFAVGEVPSELLPLEEDDTDELGGDAEAEPSTGEPARVFLVGEEPGGEGRRVLELPEPLTEELRLEQLVRGEADTAELRLALLNRVRAELLTGDLAEAEASLERAEALDPADGLVAVHRAWIRYLAGEEFLAAWEAEQAYALGADDPEVVRLVEALARELRPRLA